MQLTDLEAKFVNDTHHGLMLGFQCPKCRKHRIAIPVIVTPQDGGESGRWGITSIELSSLTCSPSILHDGGYYEDLDKPVESYHACTTHFFIRSGAIVWA